MTSPTNFPQPPNVAVWLVKLFAPAADSESIVGDLLEEFSNFASNAGVVFARRWYWRQTIRSIAHLFSRGFASAPWSVTAVVAGGFLLLRFVSGLPDMLLSAVTDHYLAFWSTHFQAYVWVLRGMLLAHLLAIVFVGTIVALVAKGREMVATVTLALSRCALIGVAFLWVGMHGRMDIEWVLLSCADPFLILASGLVVRIRRSVSVSLRSGA